MNSKKRIWLKLPISFAAGLLLGMTQITPYLSIITPVILVLPFTFLLGDNNHQRKYLPSLLLAFCFYLGFIGLDSLWTINFGFSKMTKLIIGNTSLFTIFTIPALSAKKYLPDAKLLIGGLAIFGWVTLEVLHQSWDLAFPLHSLGTTLVEYPSLTGIYRFIGATGGTICLLTISFLITLLINSNRPIPTRSKITLGATIVLVIIGAFLLSLRDGSLLLNSEEKRIAILHPNLDVRAERQSMNQAETVNYYLDLINRSISRTDSIDYIVAPENVILDGGWVDDIQANSPKEGLRTIQSRLPGNKLECYIGAIVYKDVTDLPRTAIDNRTSDGRHYFHAYNVILKITREYIDIAHIKERLVPFEEFLPYPSLLGQSDQRVGNIGFYLNRGGYINNDQLETNGGIGHLICYESAFSFEVAQKVLSKNFKILTAHLNEGWYDSYVGARKFDLNAAVRAIETQRYVLKSSNRGISSAFDYRGRPISAQHSKEVDVLLVSAMTISQNSWYVKFGHYFIPRATVAIFFSLIMWFFYAAYKASKRQAA